MEIVGDQLNRNSEYTTVIDDIYKQIEDYKAGHDSLKKELKILITENRSLSNKYKELLEDKITALPTEDESEEVACLKDQIETLTREKTCSYDLWQNSLKIIDQLENELRIRRYKTSTFELKNEEDKTRNFDQEISDLKTQVEVTNKLLESTKQKYEEVIEKQNQDLLESLKIKTQTETKLQQLQNDFMLIKKQIKLSESNIKELQTELKEKDNLILKLREFEMISKNKINEAVSLAELAIIDKNTSLDREKQANEQIEQLKAAMKDLVNEAGEKVKKEVETVKDDYNQKLKQLIKDMKNLKDELKDKNDELEKEKKKSKNLQDDLDRIKIGSIYAISEDEKCMKILDLERKMESTFQKLVTSERRVVQLISERDGIQMDLDQMANNFARASKDYELQKKNLQLTIQELRDQSSSNNVLLGKYEEALQSLTIEADKVETELKNKINEQNKIINEHLPEQIKQIQNSNSKVKKELQSYIKSEQDLNKKWKKEMKIITDKFQQRLKELKAENKELKIHLKNTVLTDKDNN